MIEAFPADSPGQRRRRRLEIALIAAVALTLNLAGNGRASLWDRDEPRYAGCTREMRERGDWILPTFNGAPRYHKPVLIYWLMRAGFAVGGDNPFGARLVSALAGTATCLTLLAMGRRMFGPRIGFLASLMLATSPIMVVESKLATTDAVLTLFLTTSQFLLWELSRRRSRTWAAAFWVLLGLSVLTKGPIGPALIAMSGLMSWFWGGPTSGFRRLDWLRGLVYFTLVTTPWFIAVGILSQGEFFRYSVGTQIGERLTTQMEQHGGFPGYYLVTSLVTFHPWSALMPAAFYWAWTRRKVSSDYGFLMGWTIGPLILLECVPTKLVHYYLPAYPACALLAACFLDMLAKEGANLRALPLGRLGFGMLATVGLGMSIALVAVTFVAPASLRPPCLAIACVIAPGTLWAAVRFQKNDGLRAVAGLATTWGVAMFLIGAWLAPSFEPYRTSHIVGKRLAVLSEKSRSQPVLFSFQEPTIIYSMGRPAVEIRTWEKIDELLETNDSLAAAANSFEVKAFAKHPHLQIEIVETLDAFNLSNGKSEKLQLALIRRKPGPLKDDALQLIGGSSKEPLIKRP